MTPSAEFKGHDDDEEEEGKAIDIPNFDRPPKRQLGCSRRNYGVEMEAEPSEAKMEQRRGESPTDLISWWDVA